MKTQSGTQQTALAAAINESFRNNNEYVHECQCSAPSSIWNGYGLFAYTDTERTVIKIEDKGNYWMIHIMVSKNYSEKPTEHKLFIDKKTFDDAVQKAIKTEDDKIGVCFQWNNLREIGTDPRSYADALADVPSGPVYTIRRSSQNNEIFTNELEGDFKMNSNPYELALKFDRNHQLSDLQLSVITDHGNKSSILVCLRGIESRTSFSERNLRQSKFAF